MEDMRAQENRAYVRRLLAQRQPGFSAALDIAVLELAEPVVVGFGDCETDEPVRYGRDEVM